MFYVKIVLELELFDVKDRLGVVELELNFLWVILDNIFREFVLKEECVINFEWDIFEVKLMFENEC